MPRTAARGPRTAVLGRYCHRHGRRPPAGPGGGPPLPDRVARSRPSWFPSPSGLRPRRSGRPRPHGPGGSPAPPPWRPARGPDRQGEGSPVIPILLLLLAIAAIYVGTIETAFGTLMRLSLRLMVERGGRDDRLGFYFDDPIRLFLPARLILGIIFSLATMSIAILTGRTGSLQSIGMLMVFVAIFILICEHVVPMFIARRDPERVLEVLLPPFDVAARFVQPLTNMLVRLIVDARRDRHPPPVVNGGDEEEPEAPIDAPDLVEEQRMLEGDERRLLRSIVDFGDTLVREVMTPRPDIVAISHDASVAQL